MRDTDPLAKVSIEPADKVTIFITFGRFNFDGCLLAVRWFQIKERYAFFCLIMVGVQLNIKYCQIPGQPPQFLNPNSLPYRTQLLYANDPPTQDGMRC